MESVLAEIYYDPKHQASFGSLKNLYLSAKKKIPSISQKDVRNWLKSQLTYTLHKGIRRNFKRNQIIVSEIDEMWQADLVDLKEFAKENDGNRYILTVIDLFSKYAWAKAIKQKTGKNVCQAFKSIFATGRKPTKLQTDQGKEFLNTGFKKLMLDNDINFFVARGEKKCSIIERFNRTFKEKMFKYFTSKGTRRYIEKIDEFVISYNNRKHRSTKLAPIEVNSANKNDVFLNLYGEKSLRCLLKKYHKHKKHKLHVGDKVRLKYDRKALDKGYYPNWTDRIFTISKVLKNNPKVYYRVTDENNQQLNGRLYAENIQQVYPSIYRIEKILKRRKYKNKTLYFVKWLNYPSSYNSWIDSKEVLNFSN